MNWSRGHKELAFWGGLGRGLVCSRFFIWFTPEQVCRGPLCCICLCQVLALDQVLTKSRRTRTCPECPLGRRQR